MKNLIKQRIFNSGYISYKNRKKSFKIFKQIKLKILTIKFKLQGLNNYNYNSKTLKTLFISTTYNRSFNIFKYNTI